MAKLISKTYGEALFELAVEENKVDAFEIEMEQLQDILKENPDFSRLMNHPKIINEEKVRIIEEAFKGRFSDELTGFLVLIVQKDRYGKINEILDFFLSKVKEFKGIGIAKVTTAVALTEKQKKEIEERLLETTSFRQMEMHYQIEDDLIGGMVIRIGDRVVDSSIKTRLKTLEKQLLQIQLSN